MVLFLWLVQKQNDDQIEYQVELLVKLQIQQIIVILIYVKHLILLVQ